MGMGSSCISATNGWDTEDVRAANRALEKWQLVQKGHTIEEANQIIAEEEAKQLEGPIDIENTLLGRLGGMGNIKWIFSDFYKRIMTEYKVNTFFEGVDMSMIRGMPVRMSAFMCHIFAGPDQFRKPYKGQDIHKYMRKIHIPLIRDKGLSEYHFNTLLEHMDQALQVANVNQVIMTEALTIVGQVRHLIFDPAPGEAPGLTDKPAEPFSAGGLAHSRGPSAIAVGEGTEAGGAVDPAAVSSGRVKRCPFSGFSVRM